MPEVNIKLPRPHPGQLKVIQSKARYKVLSCGRRWGKSLVCMIIAITDMLAGKKVAYVTPEFGLAKDFFGEFMRMLPKKVVAKSNKSELNIELVTNGSIRFFSGEALDNFRGRKFHKVIIDEAAFISNLQEAWNQSIRPTLTDYKGDALFISTPKGRNFFDALFTKGKNGEQGYESFHFTSYDNPYIDPLEIDEARATVTQAAFRQEYLAEPMEDAQNPFGIDNIRKNIISNLPDTQIVVYAIDIAKYNDWTVVTGLDVDGNLCYYDRFQQPWETTKNKIKELPSNVLKVIDATGVGDVIFEELQIDVTNIEGFKFTGESKPKIMFELIKDVEMGLIKYNEEIANEMYTMEYKYSSTGHLKFQAASGYHDDGIMSLAMANHYRKDFKLITNWKLYELSI